MNEKPTARNELVSPNFLEDEMPSFPKSFQKIIFGFLFHVKFPHWKLAVCYFPLISSKEIYTPSFAI